MTEKLPLKEKADLPQDNEEQFEYQLLTGHHRTDGTYKTDEQLRMQYIQLTDKLIHTMTEGVEVEDRETGEKRIERPDVVVWLDKSARPLAWLTRELWNKLAPEPNSNEVPKIPDFKFANIDREQWANAFDPEDVGVMNIDNIDSNIIRSLRSIYVSNKYKKDGLTEAIDEAPSELDNKTILIVDEVRSTGRTLNIAKKFFEKAFPTARIAGTHWMSGIATRGSATGNADLPIWYKENHIYGRGVGNRNADVSLRSKNTTQRLGAWFLSTRLPGPDKQTSRLRTELRHLAEQPDVPIIPDFSRKDLKERMEAYNDAPFEEVRDQMRTIKEQK